MISVVQKVTVQFALGIQIFNQYLHVFVMLLYAFRHFPLVNRGQTGRPQYILDGAQLRLEEFDALLELE